MKGTRARNPVLNDHHQSNSNKNQALLIAGLYRFDRPRIGLTDHWYTPFIVYII